MSHWNRYHPFQLAVVGFTQTTDDMRHKNLLILVIVEVVSNLLLLEEDTLIELDYFFKFNFIMVKKSSLIVLNDLKPMSFEQILVI